MKSSKLLLSHESSSLLICLFQQECKPKLCGFKLISDDGTDADPNKLYKFAQIPSGYFHPSIGGTEFGVDTRVNGLVQ